MDSGKLCIPGERLFKAGDEYLDGSGTYVLHGHIYASVAGHLKISIGRDGKKNIVEIERPFNTKKTVLTVPTVGDVVTCKVLSTFSRHVTCLIYCVRDQTLAHPFTAAIRKEDVVEIEKHKVDLFKSFRTGDILLAKVLSFGDVSSYLLTTAEDTLGVTRGRCQDGHRMLPLDENAVHCSHCDHTEPRKIAKISV